MRTPSEGFRYVSGFENVRARGKPDSTAEHFKADVILQYEHLPRSALRALLQYLHK